jgi:ribosomal protein S20
MTIGSISAAGLSQYVLASGTSTQVQRALQGLQDSLASGDLNSAQSAFLTVQKLNQNSATAIGNNLSSSSQSQLSTDLTALGSALSSGDLSTAQSAFATVQSDLKNAASPSQTNEINAASQSEQLVQELLSSLNSSSSPSSTTSDRMTSVLQAVYGSNGSLNVHA